MAAPPLLVDTDILIDYLKGIGAACALVDSAYFDLCYSSWTRKELLSKSGLTDRERREVEALLARFRVAVDDGVAEEYWILLKKYESNGLRQADAIIAATARHSSSDPQSKTLSIHH